MASRWQNFNFFAVQCTLVLLAADMLSVIPHNLVECALDVNSGMFKFLSPNEKSKQLPDVIPEESTAQEGENFSSGLGGNVGITAASYTSTHPAEASPAEKPLRLVVPAWFSTLYVTTDLDQDSVKQIQACSRSFNCRDSPVLERGIPPPEAQGIFGAIPIPEELKPKPFNVIWALPSFDDLQKELHWNVEMPGIFPSSVETYFQDILGATNSNYSAQVTSGKMQNLLPQLDAFSSMLATILTEQEVGVNYLLAQPNAQRSALEPFTIQSAGSMLEAFFQAIQSKKAQGVTPDISNIFKPVLEFQGNKEPNLAGDVSLQPPRGLLGEMHKLAMDIQIQSEMIASTLESFQKFQQENPELPWVKIFQAFEKTLQDTAYRKTWSQTAEI